MPMTLKMSWAGGLKFTGQSAFGHTLVTDGSKEAGGEAEGYKPSELVLFGLAGCTGIDVVRILAKQHQELASLDIEVTGHQPETLPRPFHTVEVSYFARGNNLDPNKLEQAIALSEEKYCMVSQSLRHEVKVTTAFEILPDSDESNSCCESLSRQTGKDRMNTQFAYTITTDKPFGEVVSEFERLVPEHQFRVLHIHDVQATLAEKGFARGPLKIIEVCNSSFAHQALQKEPDVALFMPCRYSVYTQDDKTVVSLGRPSVISQMMPNAGLDELATDVEKTLVQIMEKVVAKPTGVQADR